MPPKQEEQPKKRMWIEGRNIDDLTKEELEVHVKGLVKKIFLARKTESNLRREIDLIRTMIDNTREKLRTKRDYKYITLTELEITDPKVSDQLQEAREHLKYLDYNIVEIGKEKKNLIEQERLTFLDSRDTTVEQELWDRKERYLEELEEAIEACRRELDIGDPSSKQKIKDFKKSRIGLLNERKKLAKMKHEQYTSIIKKFELNSYHYMKLRSYLFWMDYRSKTSDFYIKSKNLDQIHINRLIRTEDQYYTEFHKLQDKIKKIREQISREVEDITFATAEAPVLNKILMKLMVIGKDMMIDINLSERVATQIKQITKEKQELTRETDDLKSRRELFAEDFLCFTKLIIACKKISSIDMEKQTGPIVDHLSALYENLSQVVYTSLLESAPLMDPEDRKYFLGTFLKYIEKMNPLRNNVMKEVKAYNDLIDYAEGFLKRMGFYSHVPFTKTYYKPQQDMRPFTENEPIILDEDNF